MGCARKHNPQTQQEHMRLDRKIAQEGGYSRKEAQHFIRRGRVTVDNVLCRNIKEHVGQAHIAIDGVPMEENPAVWVFHKPMNMLTAQIDEQGRSCVGDWVPQGYHIVGRLDFETRGLLLFSRFGALTQYILHPKRAFEREYIATVEGEPDFATLAERLAQGIETSVGLAQAKLLSVEGNRLRLIVQEGKNRIVRRMLHNAGHSVTDLWRVRFALFSLGDMAEGQKRPATAEELQIFPDEIIG